LRWTPPKTTHGIDRRRVANPVQARTLLHAVGQQRGGRRLVAFFGCLYYAALRPEEAISLAKHNLSLPTRGWGELHIERAEPYAGKEWTDSGRNRDQRPLKQRARGEIRLVPCPPPLTDLLHAHIQEFGVQPDGRLFIGERNSGELPTMTIGRVWRRARQAAFTPRSPPHRWRRRPTTFGTRPSPPGSTAACRPPRWPSGPGTRSRSCSGSMPSASTATTCWSAGASRRRSDTPIPTRSQVRALSYPPCPSDPGQFPGP
jgi:hypothetical protein